MDHVPGNGAVDRIGFAYLAHGFLCVVGGILFGVVSWRAGVFPRWAAGLFVAGSAVSLAVGEAELPDELQIGANTMRNVALVGFAYAALDSTAWGGRWGGSTDSRPTKATPG